MNPLSPLSLAAVSEPHQGRTARTLHVAARVRPTCTRGLPSLETRQCTNPNAPSPDLAAGRLGARTPPGTRSRCARRSCAVRARQQPRNVPAPACKQQGPLTVGGTHDAVPAAGAERAPRRRSRLPAARRRGPASDARRPQPRARRLTVPAMLTRLLGALWASLTGGRRPSAASCWRSPRRARCWRCGSSRAPTRDRRRHVDAGLRGDRAPASPLRRRRRSTSRARAGDARRADRGPQHRARPRGLPVRQRARRAHAGGRLARPLRAAWRARSRCASCSARARSSTSPSRRSRTA